MKEITDEWIFQTAINVQSSWPLFVVADLTWCVVEEKQAILATG